MKTIKAFTYLCGLIAVFTLVNSCKKDKDESLTDLVYDVAVDGNQVTFTTKTTGISSYKWDFGDGGSSTDQNPVHTYPGKGKYVPTLTATINGKEVDASTVLRIAKASPVKINDNTLSDWDNVTANVITSGPDGGIFRKVKFDYDGNYIYVYIETASTKAKADILDFYIDADNNAGTGYSGAFPDGGYDVVLEGPITTGLEVSYHSGPQSGFGFELQKISEATHVGTIIEKDGLLMFEIRMSRGKLKGLTGTAVRIGIIANSNDWLSTMGYAPDEGQPSFLLDMNE